MIARGCDQLAGAVDGAGHDVVDRLSVAAIDDVGRLDARELKKVHAVEVRQGPHAIVSHFQAFALLLGVLDVILERVGGEILAHHHDAGRRQVDADVIEIGSGVVGQLGAGRHRGRMRAHVAEADRVAIGFGVLAAQRARGATGSGDVLDDDALAEVLAHDFAQDAGRNVRRAACRKRYDQRDWTFRPGLCSGGQGGDTKGDGARADEPCDGARQRSSSPSALRIRKHASSLRCWGRLLGLDLAIVHKRGAPVHSTTGPSCGNRRPVRPHPQ